MTDASNVVQMTRFGKMGRAGNQFFQYMFLSGYAEKHGLELQLPPWFGNELFGLSNPLISKPLPPYREIGGSVSHSTPPQDGDLHGKDFIGFAQFHTSYYVAGRDKVQEMFRPNLQVEARLSTARKNLNDSEVSIGLHLRRGDYGRTIFPLVPTDWYTTWLEEHLPRLKGYKLFIASEDAEAIKEFEQYNPCNASDLGAVHNTQLIPDYQYLPEDLRRKDPNTVDWYPDFYLLSHCDIVLGGSSTFSFFAAMLNPYLQEYWRATLAARRFVKTDPWDAHPLTLEDLRQFPDIPGIAAHPDNPYWK